MSGRFIIPANAAAGLVIALLGGCSTHPIPDQVSRYDTAEIVRNVRCEAKDAVRQKIVEGLHHANINDVDRPDDVLRDWAIFSRIQKRSPKLAAKFKAYGISTISYEFRFDITEKNSNSGDLTFTLPFSSGGSFTLPLEGQFDKTRQAVRTFRTVERFQDLVDLDCGDWERHPPNMAYPLTGSIGVGRIITSFINISELGSLDPSRFANEEEKYFTDVIKFTTEVGGSAHPKLVLKEVPDRFKLTSANVTTGKSRKDEHQVTVALLFPNLSQVQKIANAGQWKELSDDIRLRTQENNCVATERQREERFRMLRRSPPAIYCRRNAPAAAALTEPLAAR